MNIFKTFKLNNYWENNDPASQILHISGGSTLKGAIETLKARGLSYNYAIYKGNVYELVHWKNSAWHAGVVSKMALKAKAFFSGINPNKRSIGIVFIQPFGTTQVPEKDVTAYVKLTKWLGQETGVRYTVNNIFTHHEVTSYKPKEVMQIRDQVVEALVGAKDNKDAQKKTILQLMLQIAMLRLRLLLKKQKNV